MTTDANNELTGQESAPEVAPKRASKSFTLVRHLITIKRDAMTEIPDNAYDHELPLLHEAEGEENITIHETVELEVPDFDMDVEYDRLVLKYDKRKPGVVQTVFGRTPKGLAAEIGVKYEAGSGPRLKREPEQSMQEVGKNPNIKRVIKKATPKVTNEASKKGR